MKDPIINNQCVFQARRGGKWHLWRNPVIGAEKMTVCGKQLQCMQQFFPASEILKRTKNRVRGTYHPDWLVQFMKFVTCEDCALKYVAERLLLSEEPVSVEELMHALGAVPAGPVTPIGTVLKKLKFTPPK